MRVFLGLIIIFSRSSAIDLLQRIHKEGNINVLHILKLSLQQLQSDYQLLAANLLLQLDTLVSFLITVAYNIPQVTSLKASFEMCI